jgi:outer membrane protein assembly factor BamB
MSMSMFQRIALAVLIAVAASLTSAAADFVDPAPPAVTPAPAPPSQPPAPRPQKELTFHAAARALSKDAVTHDWLSFLGPTHSPVSPESHLIENLKEMKPVWEVEKGNGYSAPAIFRDSLVLFHRAGDEEVVERLHPETGQRYWRISYPSEYVDRYGYTNGPRCAPVIDKDNGLVFTCGAEGKLHAIDLASGHVVWKRDVLKEFALEQNFFGVGATPLLESGLLIINAGAKNACAVGIDPKSGKIRWAAAAPKDWGPSYASPVPATVHGLRRVLVFAGGESRPASGGLLCLDPTTGAVDFSFPWRGRRYESVNASSPLLVDGDKVFISECYGKGGVLLQLSREGDKLAHKVLWESDKLGTHFKVALPKDGHLYGCDGHGPNNCPLVCIDAATGQEKWRTEPDLSETVKLRTGETRKTLLSTDRCHLLHADGKTYCLTEWGHLVVLDLSPKGCTMTSRRWFFAAGETWTPPVISRGLLYISQNQPDKLNAKPQRLLCFDLRK